MGGERKENLQSEPCDWCSGSSFLNVGPGLFRDVDWEPMAGVDVGIPVCGGCGGLGEQYDSEDFKAKAGKAGDLRFKFYDAVRAKNLSEQLQAIEKLEKEIKDLVAEYGHGAEGSFAQTVAEGALTPRIEYLKGLH